MKIGTIDLDKLGGISDKIVGLGKELCGVLLGRDGLQEQGQAQQVKGTKELEALRAEAEAQASRTKARAEERTQQGVQKGKEDTERAKQKANA